MAASTAKFTITSGELAGKVIELEPGQRLVFGREAGDVALPDKRISRRHCLVEVQPEGTRIRDLNSTNGTFLNGESIAEAILKNGDKLRVGFTDLLYEVGTPEVSPTDETEDLPLRGAALPVEEAEHKKFVRSKSRIIAAKKAAMGEEAPSKARQLISAKGRFCEACGEAVSPEEAKEMDGIWLCPMCALIAEKQKEKGGDFLPSYAKVVGGRLPGRDTAQDVKMKDAPEFEIEDVSMEELLGTESLGEKGTQTSLADEEEGKEEESAAGAEQAREEESAAGAEQAREEKSAEGADQAEEKEGAEAADQAKEKVSAERVDREQEEKSEAGAEQEREDEGDGAQEAGPWDADLEKEEDPAEGSGEEEG